jgi:hypothetical protein
MHEKKQRAGKLMDKQTSGEGVTASFPVLI